MQTTLLIFHFTGVGMLLGGALAGFVLRQSLSNSDNEFIGRMQPHIKPISMIASLGFGLLLVTGVAMTLGKWCPDIMKAPLFHVKLTLVFLQIIFMGFTHASAGKARRQPENEKFLKRASSGLLLMSLNALGIIVVATVLFQ